MPTNHDQSHISMPKRMTTNKIIYCTIFAKKNHVTNSNKNKRESNHRINGQNTRREVAMKRELIKEEHNNEVAEEEAVTGMLPNTVGYDGASAAFSGNEEVGPSDGKTPLPSPTTTRSF